MKTKLIASLISATALTAMVASPVIAQDLAELKAQLEALTKKVELLEKQMATAAVVKKAEPAPSIATKDGQFEMNLRGRIYTDFARITDGDGTMDVTATEFRAARIGIEGKAWGHVKYKFEADFAGNDVAIKDAYMQYNGIKVGQFKTPNSLDEQTSSRHISVMERASFTDAFGLTRQIGIGYGIGGQNYTVNAGVFVGDAGQSAAHDSLAFAARGTYGGEFDGGNYLLGASFRYRDNKDGGNIRYRQRPHQHLSKLRFVETPKLSDEDTFIGLEGAVSAGSLWAATEYAWNTSRIENSDNYTFTGGYAEIGYFLTGETRPLKLDKGAWDRPKVNNPVGKGGYGALAMVARFDNIDLNDLDVMGGKQNTYILGLNWYLNRHSRVLVNYSHSKVTEMFVNLRNGPDGKNTVNALGARFQIDW